MRKNLLEKYIQIVEGLLIFSMILSIIVVFTDGIFESLAVLGNMGLIGLGFLFFFNILYNKNHKEQQEYGNDYYNSLIELYNNKPKQFEKEYKRLLRYGTRYIALVFILVFLSIEGIIVIGVKTQIRVGSFGIFVAGLIATLYIIIKSLLVKLPDPEGYEITAESSPETVKILEKARAKTNSPALSKIIVEDGANCFVLRTKRKDFIFIGLYILMLLTPEELESIFIHEFAHIYRKDTSLSDKMNNVIIKWSKILENLQTRGYIANTLLKYFAESYITKMQLYYAASSKQREVSADKEVVKFIDKEIYAKASMKLELLEYYLTAPVEIRKLDLRAYETAPEKTHDLIIDNFLIQFEQNKSYWISQVLKRISNKADSHPSYKERMAEIGVDSFDFPLTFEKSNLPEIRKIVNNFNIMWHNNMTENWAEYIADYKKSQEIVQTYEFTEDIEKNMAYAMALEDLAKPDEALKIYRDILEKNSEYAPALYRSGVIYLNHNDEKGIELIQSAMEKDSDFIDSGLQFLLAFLDRNGLKDKKDSLREWFFKQADIYNKKTDEAENLYLTDDFVEACITNEQRQALKENLEKINSIKTVYIATKKLQYSNYDLLVVGVFSKQKIKKQVANDNSIENADEIWEVLNTLNMPCFLLNLNQFIKFIKRLSKVENSLLIKR